MNNYFVLKFYSAVINASVSSEKQALRTTERIPREAQSTSPPLDWCFRIVPGSLPVISCQRIASALFQAG